MSNRTNLGLIVGFLAMFSIAIEWNQKKLTQPQVNSAPPVLSIEGIRVGDEGILKRKDIRRVPGGNIPGGESEGELWEVQGKTLRFNIEHDRVSMVVGTRLKLGNDLILQRDDSQKQAILAINNLRSLVPGNLTKVSDDSQRLLSYTFSAGSLHVVCFNDGSVSTIQLTSGRSLGTRYLRDVDLPQ